MEEKELYTFIGDNVEPATETTYNQTLRLVWNSFKTNSSQGSEFDSHISTLAFLYSNHIKNSEGEDVSKRITSVWRLEVEPGVVEEEVLFIR